MSNGLYPIESILEAFRTTAPVTSQDGSLTLDEAVRWLNEHAPGCAVHCDLSKEEVISVSLSICAVWNDEGDVGHVMREAIATVQDNDVWAAYETAFLRACGLWGLTARAGQPASLDNLLNGLNLE